MTEPTDSELDAVLCSHWPAFSMQATLVRMWVRAAMRAAIAKWGTPPAVAGEPVAFLVCTEEGDPDMVFLDRHEATQYLEDNEQPIPLYTTPQPTQAQAGAVPLTDEQIARIARSVLETPVADGVAPAWTLAVGIARAIEAAHSIGIKGGRQ